MNPPATSTEPAQPAKTPRFLPGLLALLLAAATVAIFWPATSCGFISLDDPFYVTENPHVLGGLTWAGVKWAFTTWHAANWHPLTWLSHMADCQFFGLNAGADHAVNVFFHAANSALVFLLLLRLTRRGNGSQDREPDRPFAVIWPAAFAAAVFAWHPLRVESVAWISERKDVLSAFFALLALLAYARFTRESGTQGAKAKILYALTFLLFALGLLAKPMLVTLPFVFLLLDYWPFRRMDRLEFKVRNFLKLLVEKLPFFLLTALSCVITFKAQHTAGAVAPLQVVPLVSRLENVPLAYTWYLFKMAWPTKLAFYYPLPKQISLAAVAAATGFLLLITAAVWLGRWRRPYALVGWLWYVGTLVPVIGLVQVGSAAVASRYTYLPSLGVMLFVACGIKEFLHRHRCQTSFLPAAAAALALLCALATRHQLGYWRNGVTLFRHTIAVTRNNSFAHYNLGLAFNEHGQSAKAAREFEEALRLNPDDAASHNNLGVSLFNLDRPAGAVRQYQEAIRLQPDYADAHNNLGVVFFKLGRTNQAAAQYREALRFKPDDAEAHYNLGLVLSGLGQTTGAIQQFQETIQLNPYLAQAHFKLGLALSKSGQSGEAVRQYWDSIRLDPDFADAHYNLGNALLKTGRTTEAIRQYQAAIRLNPNDAQSHNNLGAAFYNQGQTEAAVRQFQEALRLDPNSTSARENLARARKLGHKPDAKPPASPKP